MKYIKYPKIPHLSYSNSIGKDDIIFNSSFDDKDVVITEKMDGENTALYNDYLHARSINSGAHISRNWLKAFHSNIKYLIPENYRICGEYLYAKHSILYENLPSYFLVFGIFREICRRIEYIAWDDVEDFCTKIGFKTVPVLFSGIYNDGAIGTLINDAYNEKREGFVIRNRSGFPIDVFQYNIAKFVRPSHVKTDSHWRHQKVIANKIKRRE